MNVQFIFIIFSQGMYMMFSLLVYATFSIVATVIHMDDASHETKQLQRYLNQGICFVG